MQLAYITATDDEIMDYEWHNHFKTSGLGEARIFSNRRAARDAYWEFFNNNADLLAYGHGHTSLALAFFLVQPRRDDETELRHWVQRFDSHTFDHPAWLNHKRLYGKLYYVPAAEVPQAFEQKNEAGLAVVIMAATALQAHPCLNDSLTR